MSVMAEESANQIQRDILASLRIWSEDHHLSDVAPLLGISSDRICRKGQRRIVKGRRLVVDGEQVLVRAPDHSIPYRCHFASSGDESLPDREIINPWLLSRLTDIERASSVSRLLQNDTIEATLWIFISNPAGLYSSR